MKRTTSTTITLVALTALAACATPVAGKVVPVKKYMETHSREELRELIARKRGSTGVRAAHSERRQLAAGDYCEVDSHCEAGEECQYWDTYMYASSYRSGNCVRYCTSSSDCDQGTYCSSSNYGSCQPCYNYADFDLYDMREQGSVCSATCSAHSDCSSVSATLYCSNNFNYNSYKCSSCASCWSWNTFDYSTCPNSCVAPSHTYSNTNYQDEAGREALQGLPSDCWLDAAQAEYDDMYVGDCGAFGEETELWCDGFCISNSWLDCCDPKAGAIAALTMGCFFAFVGALFTAAWIFKCWCFKKPNALMLQAMANQQQQRAMAAGHMQSPVVVQMQAPVAK